MRELGVPLLLRSTMDLPFMLALRAVVGHGRRPVVESVVRAFNERLVDSTPGSGWLWTPAVVALAERDRLRGIKD